MIDPAFARALERIPEQLRRDEFRFNQILSRQKVPVGQAWNAAGGANYAWNDPKMAGWLYEGHNYGVNCGHGGLVVPDLDDPARLEELGNIAKFPETFTVRTGRGGYHYYYICPELKEKIIIHDPELTDSEGEPLHLGEVQTLGQQVVGPGSIHPNGNTYEVINPASIAEISKEALLACLQGLRLSSDKNGQNEDLARGRRSRCSGGGAGALISIDEVCWPDNVKERAGSEVRGSHPVHGSTGGKNLGINTAKNTWYCFRHGTGGGPLEWLAVEAGLIRCEDAKPGCLSDRELFKAALKVAKDKGFRIPDKAETAHREEKSRSLLERALLYLAGMCDGATSTDGTGFNKMDAHFGKAMAAKVEAGERLTLQEYNDVRVMLRTYNKKQLAPAGLDVRFIPKEMPVDDLPEAEAKAPKPSPEALEAAREILQSGNPIDAHLSYIGGKVHGGEKTARAAIMAGYSAFMPSDDRLHADAVGSAQSGKSTIIAAALETFPEENVIVTSEASPKSLYYLAQQNPERLKDAIVYIDDARADHIPVLKTFRNEGNVTPRNLTVADGEVLELVVQYRPVVLASSVTPLRDLEQQATSRTFLVSIPDATKEEEKEVRAAIRKKARAGAILSQQTDDQLKILRAMAVILRDEGIREVLVPFDAVEPKGADRRGTGQFQRLIKVSAFVNQYQRPILELKDGRRFVLAVYADLEMAAEVWFDFAEGQEFKISSKSLDVLKKLPSTWPGKTAPTIAKETKIPQRSTDRYLEDLYESGIASREKISAPGLPWGYWCEPETRQKVLTEISASSDGTLNSTTLPPRNLWRKYMAEKSSDSLKDSYINFFTNSVIIDKEMYKGIIVDGALDRNLPEEIYYTIFSRKSWRNSKNGSDDSEYLKKDDLAELTETPLDVDSENGEKVNKPGRIAEELAEVAERRRLEEERARTPEKPADPSALADFSAKVAAYKGNQCHKCGTLLAGIGGREDPETRKWYCMPCWQANHPPVKCDWCGKSREIITEMDNLGNVTHYCPECYNDRVGRNSS